MEVGINTMANINIELPEDLHKELRIKAINKNISMKDLIIIAIEKEIKRK